jgi:hypothetical protein
MIKSLLLSMILLPLGLFAQDCKIKRSIDPYTKETKVSTGFVPFGAGSDRFHLTVDASKTELEFIVSLNNAKEGKCFSDASTAVLTFEGGKIKSTIKNTGSMNCEGSFTLGFKNTISTPAPVKNLISKKVINIKLTGNGKQVTDLILTDKEGEALRLLAGCLVAEAKALLVVK